MRIATTRAARPVWQRPVVQFVVVGLVVAVFLAWITGVLGERLSQEQAIDDARATTTLLAETVAEPALSSGLLDTQAGDLDRFDRLVRTRVLRGEVVRVKVWDAEGRIVYSDEPRLIDQTFALGADQREVLANGGSDAEVSDLSKSENTLDQQLGRVLEVYSRIEAPSGEPLLFELYLSDDNLKARADELYRLFRPLTVGGLLLFLLLTTPLVWVLSRRADAAADDRERLLVMAADASDAERRRVARDLHDGVVQDLAGTSFALSGIARESASTADLDRAALSGDLDRLAAAVRRSLLGLRSLLVEIYPPELDGVGLGAALQDLVANARESGIEVRLDVTGTDGLGEDVTALIWRTAQECVRNATRHGSPDHLTVTVTVTDDPGVAALTVSDDGAGFDAETSPKRDSFGLRGLRDLAREAGGTLTVTSAPDEGTTARLEVPAS
ncbi:MAG TPA: ATP-binding protein [Actinomycetes bacterium]|nr:ATP-binding protein [Actinomycetes bacterium]